MTMRIFSPSLPSFNIPSIWPAPPTVTRNLAAPSMPTDLCFARASGVPIEARCLAMSSSTVILGSSAAKADVETVRSASESRIRMKSILRMGRSPPETNGLLRTRKTSTVRRRCKRSSQARVVLEWHLGDEVFRAGMVHHDRARTLFGIEHESRSQLHSDRLLRLEQRKEL